MNDFITKPFEESALLHTIVKWTGKADSRPAGLSAGATTKTDQPLYDLKTLNDISRGNREFVAKMVRLFAEQAPALASEILASYESGDLQRMGSTAHKLKPSIDNMGIVSLKDPIRAIEKAGKEAHVVPGLEQTIHLVVNTIDKVVAALKDEFDE
jgi:HPt (histidine-containing phosphotransfer) domain-containing protein